MRSTGEVMGIDRTFGLAFAKSQLAAGDRLPDRRHGVPLARRPRQGGGAARRPAASSSSASRIAATAGTADYLEADGVPVATAGGQARRATTGIDAVELIESGKVDLVVNSPRGRGARADGAHIRAAAGVAQRPVPHHRGRRPAPPPTGIADWAAPRAAGADRCRSTTAAVDQQTAGR